MDAYINARETLPKTIRRLREERDKLEAMLHMRQARPAIISWSDNEHGDGRTVTSRPIIKDAPPTSRRQDNRICRPDLCVRRYERFSNDTQSLAQIFEHMRARRKMQKNRCATF